MGRKVGVGVLAIIALGCVLIAAILIEAHLEMRGITPPLPEVAAVASLAAVEGGPVRIRYINTATQRGPDSAVMGFTAYLLEWADGRSFLIDAGMEREEAEVFGEPIELLLGADPIEPHGSVAELMGEAKARVAGAGFTHLHSDHTGGFPGLCAGGDSSITLFQTRWQAERGNYGTIPGSDDIEEASCARLVVLDGSLVQPVPGFPGLFALAAGGHTPGSTIFVAHVGESTWVFSGDITNFIASVEENRPKALPYSLFVVPENRDHLEHLRLWLRDLDAVAQTIVVPSHDLGALEETGMEPFVIASR